MQMIMKDVKTMTDKAYIVTNEEQEHEVLNDLERQGIKWVSGGEKPTEFTPKPIQFPYGLFTDDEGHLQWGNMRSLEDEEIVFDGRKEEHMSEKYVVSQEFMNKLEEWKYKYFNDANYFVSHLDIMNLPHIVSVWKCDGVYDNEANNRLIAIIRWVNGEDVFEVEKPKKWVVRSKETDEDGDYHYVDLDNFKNLKSVSTIYGLDFATKFDAKEEAQSWANSHQEVVEVEE